MGGKIYIGIRENKIKKSCPILFFLDYDGTLVPIKKRPGLAKTPKSTRQLLKRLSQKKWARVFIVTGRTLRNIKNLIGLNSISYVGNHGLELEDPHLKFHNMKAEKSKRAINHIYKDLRRSLKIKNAIIENKFYTLSLHYRLVEKKFVETLKSRFYNITIPYRKKGNIIITEGKKVFEVRPNLKWNKGKMVSWIINKLHVKKALPIYIGDDKTDEDAFRALKGKGFTIVVSKKKIPTKAKCRIKSPKDVLGFLRYIINLKDKKEF